MSTLKEPYCIGRQEEDGNEGFTTGSLVVAAGGATIERNMPIIPGRWYPEHAAPSPGT